MTYAEYDAFCAGLPGTTRVVQWGGAYVWKIGGKVFAIAGWEAGIPAFTFKVSPIGFEVLRGQAGLRPAPYLASRGFTWIQHFAAPGLTDADLRDHIRESHRIVASGLPRKTRVALGLGEAA